MSTASIAGHRCTRARVYLPDWGVWHAEVGTDDDAELSGAVEVRVADLVLQGTVLSGGPSKGRSSFRVAGGTAGWGKRIPRKGYDSDASVKASTVLVDAAAAAGETIDPATLPASAVRVGAHFERIEGPASRTMHELAPQNWYVGEDGVTRIGKRPRVDLTGVVSIGPVNRARRSVTLAARSIAGILPGVRVAGLEAVDVVHDVRAGALRSTIYGAGSAATTRGAAALLRAIEALLPDLPYRGIFEFRVVTQEGERLNLQPVRVSTGMPDLRRVVARPGLPGARADVALGSRVVVGFIDNDPGRPEVLAYENAEGDGFSPVRLDISVEDDDYLTGSADPARRVVRYGDQIAVPVVGASATGPIAPGAAGSFSRVRG
jgi:hypothetical protein